MICQLGPTGWCARHDRYHVGRLRQLALMDNALGEHYRLLWDNQPDRALPATAPAPVRYLECIHLGDVVDKCGRPCPLCWHRQCDVFGLCTLASAGTAMPACSTCAKYTATPPD